ncbi:MAG: AMP-binding protein [Bacilli bacterium]|nr:AMP-binding protein [Bacilli bacterium]
MEKVKHKTSRCDMSVFYEIADRLMTTEKTFKDIFELHARDDIRNKNGKIFIYEESGKTISIKYKEYYSLVMKYSQALSKSLIDIEKGSFVAFKITNSVKFPLGFWGLISAGYKPLLINPILSKEDTIKLIHESDAKAIISENDESYDIKNVNILTIELKEENKNPCWENEMAFCTSGTTGDSRIFGYSGKEMSYQIYSAYTMPDVTADIMYVGNVRLLAVIPFSHIFGFVAIFLWYTFFGATIVFPNSSSPNDLQQACIKYKCTHLYAVPLFFETLVSKFKHTVALEKESKQKLVDKVIRYKNKYIAKAEAGLANKKFVLKAIQKKVLGPQIVYCIAGGSALGKETLEIMNGIGYNLYNGYGMTEIGVTSVELSPNVSQRNKASVGKPLYGVTYKIENNELLVKSNYIHSFRMINGKKEIPDIDQDSYFHTGDIGEIKDGYLYIKGKVKDVIIGSNGENIYPDEIEVKFRKLQNVLNLSLVGVPTEKGEILTLFLNVDQTIDKGKIKDLENSIKEINETLPQPMQIRDIYISRNPLPMNASLKIKKYALIDDFKNNKSNYLKLSSGEIVSFEGYDKKLVEETVSKLIKIIANVLYIDKKNIAPNNHFVIDLGGDSFSYMSLIADIETNFNIEIKTDLIGKLNSANEFALYILQNKK